MQSLSDIPRASFVHSKAPKGHPGVQSNTDSLKPFVPGGLFSTSSPPPSQSPSGMKFGVPSKQPSAPPVDFDPKIPSAPLIDALTPKQRHASVRDGFSPKQPSETPLGNPPRRRLHRHCLGYWINFLPLSISTSAVSKNVPIPEGYAHFETDSQHKPTNNGSTTSLLRNSNLDLVTKANESKETLQCSTV